MDSPSCGVGGGGGEGRRPHATAPADTSTSTTSTPTPVGCLGTTLLTTRPRAGLRRPDQSNVLRANRLHTAIVETDLVPAANPVDGEHLCTLAIVDHGCLQALQLHQ